MAASSCRVRSEYQYKCAVISRIYMWLAISIILMMMMMMLLTVILTVEKGKGCGKCASGCFPGIAMVRTRDGMQKKISKLSIGDEVAVLDENGKVDYQDIYAYGHFEADPLSDFITITLKNTLTNTTKVLQLTPDHFAIVQLENNGMMYKRAIDVREGDLMLAMESSSKIFPFTVIDIQEDELLGLYKPFTTKGTIIVNDILASCHSHWFLDATFDDLGMGHLLPTIYQAILSPVRILYKVMSKEAYKSTYENIDSHFNITQSGANFSGYMKLLAMSLKSSSFYNDDKK